MFFVDLHEFKCLFTQAYVDELLKCSLGNIMKKTTEDFPEASMQEWLLSVAAGSAVNVSLNLLENYHIWANQRD